MQYFSTQLQIILTLLPRLSVSNKVNKKFLLFYVKVYYTHQDPEFMKWTLYIRYSYSVEEGEFV